MEQRLTDLLPAPYSPSLSGRTVSDNLVVTASGYTAFVARNPTALVRRDYLDTSLSPLYDSLDSVQIQADQTQTSFIDLNTYTRTILVPLINKHLYVSLVRTAASGSQYNLTSTMTLNLELNKGFAANDRVRFGGPNGSVDATILSYNSGTGDCSFKFDSTGALAATNCYVTLLATGAVLSGYAIAATNRTINRNDSLMTAISVLDRRSTDNATQQKGITPAALKSVVTAGSFTNGELQGNQPVGSAVGMRFCDANYRYEYMNGVDDTNGTSNVWVRLAKA